MNKEQLVYIALFFLCMLTSLLSVSWLHAYSRKKIQEFQKQKIVNKKIIPVTSPSLKDILVFKTYDINVDDTRFYPSEIHVNSNTNVVIVLHVLEGYHNFVVPDYYKIRSDGIPTGSIEKISFIATQSGSFRFLSETHRYVTEPEGRLFVD